MQDNPYVICNIMRSEQSVSLPFWYAVCYFLSAIILCSHIRDFLYNGIINQILNPKRGCLLQIIARVVICQLERSLNCK